MSELRHWSVPLVILFVLLFFPVFSRAAAYIEILPAGRIDWSNGVVEATGTGSSPEKTANKAQARGLAAQEAMFLAAGNMLKTLAMLRVDGDHFAGDRVLKRDSVHQQVKELVYRTAEVETFFLPRNRVKKTITVVMRGELASILLPSSIREIEDIKGGKLERNAGSSESPNKKAFTGLVIDCRGLKVTPALVPRVLDEDGNEIYGPETVTRTEAIRKGAAEYARGLSNGAKDVRVGANPIRIKAVRPTGRNSCDIIISNADAARIMEIPANLRFLRSAGVKVILD